MVTILTIHRMHSPWREQEVLGRQELSRRLGEARVSHCGLPVFWKVLTSCKLSILQIVSMVTISLSLARPEVIAMLPVHGSCD